MNGGNGGNGGDSYCRRLNRAVTYPMRSWGESRCLGKGAHVVIKYSNLIRYIHARYYNIVYFK